MKSAVKQFCVDNKFNFCVILMSKPIALIQFRIVDSHFACKEQPRNNRHFTVACLVACPLNESEAGGDVVLIETFLHFLC